MKSRQLSLLLLLSHYLATIAGGFAVTSPLTKPSLLRHPSGGRVLRDKARRLSTAVLSTRGGAAAAQRQTRRRLSTKNESESNNGIAINKKIALYTLVSAALIWLCVEYRVPIRNFFDKELLQQRVLNLLHRFHGDWRGVVVYMVGMTVWELLGMSTIPVETAAGMVFGFRRGFLASAFGKLFGATSGYWLGRGVLKNWTLSKLQENSILQLVNGSVSTHPFRSWSD